MKLLTFKTEINSTAQNVMDNITNKSKYEQWVGAAFPGSTYSGEWKQGSQIKFFGIDGSGTLAKCALIVPQKKICLVHESLLLPGGVVDSESEIAKGWAGAKEDYILNELNGKTELVIELTFEPEWAEMFEDSWPKMLDKLKQMCENI